MAGKPTEYYDDVDIYEYDRAIVAHPLMDQLKSGVVAAILATRGTQPSRLIDVGAGSGQMTRVLLGFPFFSIVALDKDPQAAEFFSTHPELHAVEFIAGDVFDFIPAHTYDVALCVGLYHHVPKSRRPGFIQRLLSISPLAIVADEFLTSYNNQHERSIVCRRWYEWIIGESRRRGLTALAAMEMGFMEDDLSGAGEDEGDYKESVDALRSDVEVAGAKMRSVLRYGDRERLGGEMAVATITF